jgi:hypothetical protein
MLHDRLRARPKMLEVSKADAVDASWAPAVPSAPDEPRDVEQQGRVVYQRTSLGNDGPRRRDRQDRGRHEADEALEV